MIYDDVWRSTCSNYVQNLAIIIINIVKFWRVKDDWIEIGKFLWWASNILLLRNTYLALIINFQMVSVFSILWHRASPVFTMKSINRFSQSGCRICGKMNGMYVNVLEKKSKRYLFQIRKFLQVEVSLYKLHFAKLSTRTLQLLFFSLIDL